MRHAVRRHLKTGNEIMKAILTLFLVLLVAALGRLSAAESPRGPTHAPVHGPAVNVQGTATEPRASGVTTARVSGTVIDVPPPEPVVRQRMGVAVRLRHADGSTSLSRRGGCGSSVKGGRRSSYPWSNSFHSMPRWPARRGREFSM